VVTRARLVVALAATLAAAPEVQSIAIPGGEPGVGYDDLSYAPAGKRVLAPAGRTGRLALIDPATRQVATISGFSAAAAYAGGHGQGTTSAAELDARFVVATDRGARTLAVVDVGARAIAGTVRLAAGPDYVRVVPGAREVWVTEPSRRQIEVLRVEAGAVPKLTPVATIAVPDGPESLVFDAARGRAYAHAWKGETFAVDLHARKVVARWPNGCRGSRGIALDGARGLLFSGCAEGRATVVDLATSKVVASAPTGPDVDSIGYAAPLGHLYVPAGGDAQLSIFGVGARGTLAPLGKLPTAPDAHTVAFDPASRSIFVGTPAHGAVLVARDGFPSSLDAGAAAR